jgi:CheY-like chemotaxis protein
VEGLHLATTETYDAIVLDLMLPGIDGLSLLRNLRTQKIHTPLICLTARDASTTELKASTQERMTTSPNPSASRNCTLELMLCCAGVIG